MKQLDGYQTLGVKIKTLTPVHIASGGFLVENRDYYVEGKEVRRLHYPSLLAQIPEENMDKVLHQIKNEGLRSLIPKPVKKVIKKVQVEEDWKQALRALEAKGAKPATAAATDANGEKEEVETTSELQVPLERLEIYRCETNFGREEIGNKIHEMALDNYLRAFFPGSTLKGAIRTALYLNTLSRQPQRLNRLRFTWTSNPMEADYPLEREMTGVDMKDLGKDLFRQLTVRDSNFATAANSLGLFQLKILNIGLNEEQKQVVAWKKGSKGNVERYEEADSFCWEMIRPEAEFHTEFIINSGLYSAITAAYPKMEKAAFEINPAQLVQSLNQFGKKIAEQELIYARHYKISYLESFYADLEQKCVAAAADGKLAYLSVGSGVSWHGKTIGSLLDSSSLDAIRRHFYRYMGKFVHTPCRDSFHGMRLRRGQCPKCGKQIRPEKLSCIEPFPKTRHVVFQEGRPMLPPGWISLELE